METPEETALRILKEQTKKVLLEELKKSVLEVIWGANEKPNKFKLYVFADSEEALENEIEKIHNAIREEYKKRETSMLDAKNLPPHILQYPLTPDEL